MNRKLNFFKASKENVLAKDPSNVVDLLKVEAGYTKAEENVKKCVDFCDMTVDKCLFGRSESCNLFLF